MYNFTEIQTRFILFCGKAFRSADHVVTTIAFLWSEEGERLECFHKEPIDYYQKWLTF